jgi:hypothetical protein
MRYRKKPVVVEAIQYARGDDGDVLPDWWSVACTRGEHIGGVSTAKNGQLLVFTLEGVMRADPGDWIVRGIKGELYLVKPDIFAATYEPEQAGRRGDTPTPASIRDAALEEAAEICHAESFKGPLSDHMWERGYRAGAAACEMKIRALGEK